MLQRKREDWRCALTRDGELWMVMDGLTLILKLPVANLDTPHQVYISTYLVLNHCTFTYDVLSAAVSYTKTERKRYGASQSLPVFMTLVGCYGTEDNITNCSYHEFKYSTSASTITTSMDISITCTSDIQDPTPAKVSNAMASASLSISVILAVAVIGLVAVLIVMFVMNRKKKRAKRLMHM